MKTEDKIKLLLLYILEELAKNTISTSTDDDNCTTLEFRVIPDITFDSEQMSLIKELNENELEDLSPITGD